MSIEAEFVDQAAFNNVLRQVRADGDPTRWFVIGHVPDTPSKLTVVGSGTDVNEMSGYFDDSQIQYALARVEETIDVSVTVKFVYIHWNGQGVGFAIRGRYGVVEGFVQGLLSPFHLAIKTHSREETTAGYIAGEIGRQSGQLSKVRDDVASAPNPNRPIGATKTPAPKVSTQGADVKVSGDIADVLSELRNVDSEVNCVALHYPENNIKNGLVVLLIGNQGVGSLSEFLTEDAVVYALVRVIDIVDEIPTVKYAQVKWVGDRVKPMTKAKIATQTGEIARIMGSAHVSITASHRNEVTDRAVMDRVMAASGTKKVVT